MGGRQGTANGIAKGPGGTTAPAAYLTVLSAVDSDAGKDLPPALRSRIIDRAYNNGFSPQSAVQLLYAAKAGNTQGVAATLDAFPRSLAGLNLETKIAHLGDGVLKVESELANKSGSNVGRMTRLVADTSIDHSYFKLDNSTKGQGAGYKIFKHQIDAYTRNGLKELTVSAAGGGGYNGGYTWGRFGYRFSNQDDRTRSLNGINSRMRNSGVSDKQRERIMKKLDANTARPGDIARVVAIVNGKAHHLGKELMQDRSWAGVFDLRKGSADRRYMNAYPKVSKAIRAQTGAD